MLWFVNRYFLSVAALAYARYNKLLLSMIKNWRHFYFMHTIMTLFKKLGLILFGIVIFFIILELCFQTSHYLHLITTPSTIKPSFNNAKTLTILCLGESTTALGGQSSYPSQLENILNTYNTSITFKVINRGLPGTNTTEILSRLKEELDHYRPDAVITLMGINDTSNTFSPNFFETFSPWLIHSRMYRFLFGLYISFKKNISTKYSEISFAPLSSILNKANVTPEKQKRLGDVLYYLFNKYPTTRSNTAGISQLVSSIQSLPNTPEKSTILTRCAHIYYRDHDYAEALSLYKQASAVDSGNSVALLGTGKCLKHLGMLEKALPYLEEAWHLNSSLYNALYHKGTVLLFLEKHDEAITTFQEFIKTSQKYHTFQKEYALQLLGWLFFRAGNFTTAIHYFQDCITMNPHIADPRVGLSMCYLMLNDNAKAQSIHETIKNAPRLNIMRPLTIMNYRKYKKILADNNVPWICAYYPRRNITFLKHALEPLTNIALVDNNVVFEEALQSHTYSELFTDSFGIDFGHCTKEGNRILAENIAQVIIATYCPEK